MEISNGGAANNATINSAKNQKAEANPQQSKANPAQEASQPNGLDKLNISSKAQALSESIKSHTEEMKEQAPQGPESAALGQFVNKNA